MQIASHRDLAQQLLQLLQRSSQRELAESDLVSFFLTLRVALVLLACATDDYRSFPPFP